MELSIAAIGHVAGGRTDPSDDDWGQSRAVIQLDPARFTPDALAGLDGFSHAEIIFLFDKVAPEKIEYGARHPRGRQDWPLVGIFAQRGKNRPNRLGVKLVWIGPPCVRKPWEQYSRKLDAILAAQLADTTAKYVSTQAAEFCSTRLHAAEGVHFTMAGYTRMWQKAAAAAGFSTVVASAEPARAEASEPHRRSERHHHHHWRRRHARRHATETPEQTEAAPQ